MLKTLTGTRDNLVKLCTENIDRQTDWRNRLIAAETDNDVMVIGKEVIALNEDSHKE